MKNKDCMQIGIVGLGHLGNYHVKQLTKIDDITIAGLYDIDIQRAKVISKKYTISYFDDLDKLLTICDAVTIVTPTSTHYEVANKALEYNCHIFIEKPITNNLEKAKLLLSKAKNKNKIIQVGHIERFNSAFIALEKMKLVPNFIELHRLAPFNPRGNDVPVILDLMIHDIDIILSLIKSNIINIKAKGVSIISNTVDIANARIEFANKCVVNLTASRISQKEMRKMRLFQKNKYITIDFHKCILEHYSILSKNEKHLNKGYIEIGNSSKKYISHNKVKVNKFDALKTELEHFIYSIKNNKKPKTDGLSATNALEIALKIESLIK